MIEQNHIEENINVRENNQDDALMDEQVKVEETEAEISHDSPKENISVEENISHEENNAREENSEIYETGPGKSQTFFFN